MSEKGIFNPLERLGHGLLEIIVGIGTVALGLHFFKRSADSSKENSKKK